MNSRTAPSSSPCRRRGSVLLVALLFSLIIAISLGSFINLATNASQISYRTFYQGVAMNIAESGLEQALWEMNRTTDAWSGWTNVGGGAYRKSFDMGTVSGGGKTTVKIYAQNKTYVIARAIVDPPQGPDIEKWVLVTLNKRSRQSVGGLGRKGIAVNGNNVVLASWNSDPDKDSSTTYVPFSTDVMRDKAPLATLDLDASLNAGNGGVNGTAAVGGDSLSAIKVGSQGYIGDFGTPEGTIDPDNVSTNFSTDLEVRTAPTNTPTILGSVTSDLTLPKDPTNDNHSTVDGVTTYYYQAGDISLQNTTLAISPGYNVVIVADSVSVGGGSGSINIGGVMETNTETNVTTYTPASLKLYTSGDVDIGGKGSANEVTLQTYTPEITPTTTVDRTITTTTTISNVTELRSTGKNKEVIGWKYDKKVTTTTTTGSSSTSSTQNYNNLQSLIANGDAQPVAATTTSTDGPTPVPSGTSSPAVTTVVGTQAGQPNNFWLIGTRSDADLATKGPQTFKISGNGNLSAVVDAPNASISAKGGGNGGFIYGSLIGYDLIFTGNDNFYYDESLANLDDGSKLAIDNWDELVSTEDRKASITSASSATYWSLMNF